MCKLGVRRTQHYEIVTSLRRCSLSMDFEAFLCDLSQSTLLCSLPSDVNELFACYEETLRSLVNRHAPLYQRRFSTRHSQQWFDADSRVLDRNWGDSIAFTAEVGAQLHWPTGVSSSRVNAICSNDRPAIIGCLQSTVTGVIRAQTVGRHQHTAAAVSCRPYAAHCHGPCHFLQEQD
jgi:hypothetical protein